jgi:hypothetical protein
VSATKNVLLIKQANNILSTLTVTHVTEGFGLHYFFILFIVLILVTSFQSLSILLPYDIVVAFKILLRNLAQTTTFLTSNGDTARSSLGPRTNIVIFLRSFT